MNIYEFITPSDHITFKTDDDKVAFTAALLLGNGKAGCKNIDTGDSLPTLLLFSKEPEKEISEFIGGDMKEFIASNRIKISDCLASFAYGNRESFDSACEAITDKDKLAEFKNKHENNERSSLTRWVRAAWDWSESIKETK